MSERDDREDADPRHSRSSSDRTSTLVVVGLVLAGLLVVCVVGGVGVALFKTRQAARMEEADVRMAAQDAQVEAERAKANGTETSAASAFVRGKFENATVQTVEGPEYIKASNAESGKKTSDRKIAAFAARVVFEQQGQKAQDWIIWFAADNSVIDFMDNVDGDRWRATVRSLAPQ